MEDLQQEAEHRLPQECWACHCAAFVLTVARKGVCSCNEQRSINLIWLWSFFPAGNIFRNVWV